MEIDRQAVVILELNFVLWPQNLFFLVPRDCTVVLYLTETGEIDRQAVPKQGDVIYYWIYAIIEGLGYHALDKSYTVTEGSPPPPPPVTPDRIPDPSGPCQSSSSTKNRQGGLCRGQIMLHKTFDNLDGWSYEVFIGGSHLATIIIL
ncbi:hypothetical protein J6590_053063 [Homalodisca vitripennis]|nr:hypothetical protein J6590_053063 [Homalodisca vitripennis]